MSDANTGLRARSGDDAHDRGGGAVRSPAPTAGPGLRGVITRHPLAVFIVLSFVLSWWLYPLGDGLLGSGPFLAAIAVLWVTEGRGGVRRLLRRMVQWRVAGRWYAAALLLPTAATCIAVVVAIALGAAAPSAAALGAWTGVPATFVAVLLIPAFGPWEEPGFRGFALDRLLLTRSPAVAALLVGAIQVAWHLPLFWSGDIYATDVVVVLAVGVVIGWAVVCSGGSVLIAMMMHATNNAVSGEFLVPLFSGADGTLLGGVLAVVWSLLAVVVTLRAGRWFRTRPRPPA